MNALENPCEYQNGKPRTRVTPSGNPREAGFWRERDPGKARRQFPAATRCCSRQRAAAARQRAQLLLDSAQLLLDSAQLLLDSAQLLLDRLLLDSAQLCCSTARSSSCCLCVVTARRPQLLSQHTVRLRMRMAGQ